ncbi:MAG: D-alanine--D-alanine ligase [Deltaproteobacteria bacterium]|nr:D-alanine--D-alanine ligase [Deltaproteobacteria bacterium]
MSIKIRVAILYGGRSAEHEVSLLSARNVVAALDRSRFEPILVGIDKQGAWRLQDKRALLEAPRDPRLVRLNTAGPTVSLTSEDFNAKAQRSKDAKNETSSLGVSAPLRQAPTLVSTNAVAAEVVFPVLHGPMGEDGTVQGMLELAGLPYVGAGVLGSAVGMDKDVMKRLLRDAGLPVTPFRTIRKSDFARDPAASCALAAEVGFPIFTKPANLGSSVGVRRVASASELRDALAHAFAFDTKALTEAAVDGREIECSVLGNDTPIASLPGEIIVHHKDGFYSYDAKYIDENGAALEIPAKLTPEQIGVVQSLAVRAFHALECSGLARVDLFLRRTDGAFIVNEINTIPGFTAISMYPKLWEASGIGPTELVSRLIDLALERHAERQKLKTSGE